jgi:hypothetical protein
MRKILFILFIVHYSSLICEAQWTQTNGLNGDFVYALLSYGDTIFAGTGSGTYMTTNNGNNWTSAFGTSFRSFTSTGNYLLGGTQSAGVYVSTNGGLNWIQMNSGLTASYVRALASSGTNVFAGTTTGGVFLTTNYGANWTQMNNGLANNYIFSLFFHGPVLYAGTGPSNGGVYKSTNNGSTWTYSGLVNDFVYALTSRGSVVFAGGDITGAYRSTDEGLSWTQVNSGLPNNFINSMASYGNAVLAGTQGGLYMTTNDGTSWTSFHQGLPANWIYALTYNSTYMFAGIYGGGGNVWRRPLSELVGILTNGNEVPAHFHLYQNYPNPFNPKTVIEFQLPVKSCVILKIYDLAGREVAIILNERLSQGTYEVEWDASDYPSGVYVYRLTAGDASTPLRMTEAKKMILIK